MGDTTDLLLEKEGSSGSPRRACGARAVREKLVVIGNGMASYKLCERLVASRGTERYEVVVLGEEPRPAYDRVHLTDFLGGRSAEELTLGSREWYAGNGITLLTARRVTSVDRERRIVFTDKGEEIVYDKLVFATGSKPFVPAMEGTALPRVFVYRTVEDLMAIRDCARSAKTAAVIGGGLLGLEAARALRALGIECHIVEFAPHLLCTQLDPRAGQLAKQSIENMGMRVHVNVRVRRIVDDDACRVLEFVDKDEASLKVDLVVIATGIRPRHELAEACGLTIAVPGGILVNDRLETSDPLVYAIGECASHRGASYGLVAPAYRMAEVLVENLLGGTQLFKGADLSTRLKVLGLDIAVLGEYNRSASSFFWESAGSYRRIVIHRDRLVGASAFGCWPEVGEVQDAVLKGRRVWAWQVQRFRKRGVLWPPRRRNVNQWPAEATVCNCMGVRRGSLTLAVEAGCRTVQAIADATGASTLCGSCKPLLAELVGAQSDQSPAKGAKGLAAAAFAALLLLLGLFAFRAVPYISSVQDFPYDALWRNGLLKQVTGFTLFSLSLLGLLMSARKRMRRFSWGDFGLWRALHGLLGVGGLVVLVAHTGMRFGSNLNFALMTCFAFANLAGAIAAGLISFTPQIPTPRANRTRRWMVAGHIALVWPLPLLVGFHILSVYYF